MEYLDFVSAKERQVQPGGLDVEPGHISDVLYPFQRDIVAWAVRMGRAAVFADCGMGKTLMQLEWARHMAGDGRVLIVAPISVGQQTVTEGRMLGVDVEQVDGPNSAKFQITNYEKLHHFIGADYRAIVLDESSILKSIDGKTRSMLLREFTAIPYRLCCTATPAPNDVAELGNHSEFLGAMSRTDMLASYFVHESERTQEWRLKGHAEDAFWRWVSTWAVYVRSPMDLGYPDGGFRLPPLTINAEVVDTEWKRDGELFATGLGGVGARAQVRRHTLAARVQRAASVIGTSGDQWLVWCGLNDEGRAIKAELGSQCALIEGADGDAHKIAAEAAWRRGDVRVLVCKPGMFGFGMNWQHAHRMLFLGLGDSYEQYYQSIRRCWRYGQTHPVDVRIIVSQVESEIVNNVRRKESDAARTAERVVSCMRTAQIEQVRGDRKGRTDYRPALPMQRPAWRAV